MAKVTIEGITYEGTPEELKEIFETMGGVKFPQLPESETEWKNGDYVRLLSLKGSLQGFSEGQIVKIVDINNKGVSDYGVEGFDFTWGATNKDNIVKATDEEVEEAMKSEFERKQIEEKWAKINRKPNELKEGDFVKYKKCYAEVTRVGIYDISIEVTNGDIIAVAFDAVSLVAPAESRFDKDSE